MELRESTKAILDSDDPATLLRLADKYINSFNEMPDQFVLPRDHVMLRPIIEVFHDDLGSFCEYVKAIRNKLPRADRDTVTDLYRNVYTRHVQQVRRKRADNAIKAVERVIGRRLEPDEKKRVVQNLERHWGKRRLLLLQHFRMGSKRRITVEERRDVLDRFWAEIDKEIEQGELPQFKF